MNYFKTATCVLILSLFGCGTPDTPKQGVAASAPKQLKKTGTPDYYQQGITFLKQGDVKEAVISLQRRIQEDPQDSRAFLVLGRIFINADDQKQAQQVLNIAAGLNPNSGEVQLLLAESYDKAQMPVKAIESAKKSVVLYQQQEDAANFKRSVAVWQMLSSKYQKAGPET